MVTKDFDLMYSEHRFFLLLASWVRKVNQNGLKSGRFYPGWFSYRD